MGLRTNLHFTLTCAGKCASKRRKSPATSKQPQKQVAFLHNYRENNYEFVTDLHCIIQIDVSQKTSEILMTQVVGDQRYNKTQSPTEIKRLTDVKPIRRLFLELRKCTEASNIKQPQTIKKKPTVDIHIVRTI